MEIIDNINRLLGDDLKKALVPGAKLKIAASCFTEAGVTSWKPYQKFYLEGRSKQPSNLWQGIEGNK